MCTLQRRRGRGLTRAPRRLSVVIVALCEDDQWDRGELSGTREGLGSLRHRAAFDTAGELVRASPKRIRMSDAAR